MAQLNPELFNKRVKHEYKNPDGTISKKKGTIQGFLSKGGGYSNSLFLILSDDGNFFIAETHNCTLVEGIKTIPKSEECSRTDLLDV